jgi:hypothetical protein
LTLTQPLARGRLVRGIKRAATSNLVGYSNLSSPDEQLLTDLQTCARAAADILEPEQARIREEISREENPTSRDLLWWQYDFTSSYVEWASANAGARLRYLESLGTHEKQEAELARCASNEGGLLHWMRAWAWTLDPRVTCLPVVPFVPFRFQAETIQWLDALVRVRRRDGLVDKSRDEGLSWIAVLLSVYYYLFVPFSQILFGSYKEELVDSKERTDTLLEKVRFQLRRTPSWMLPRGFSFREHAGYMKISNPQNGAMIAGAAPTENFGRAGRYTVVWLDEQASWRFGAYPQWAAVSQSSPCKISISTPKGKANKQAELRFSGTMPHRSLHWKRHPWKDERWYKGQALTMSEEEIAQELDIDYEASQPGRIFPMWSEAYHIITWSEFERVYGLRNIPRSWLLGRAQDVGTSEGHPNVTAWAARPRKNDKYGDTVFFYREFVAPQDWTIMEIAEGRWAQGNKLVAPGIWQREQTLKEADRMVISEISWEGESERRTYAHDCKRYPVQFSRIKKPGPNAGLSEMRNMMQLLPEPHPFARHPKTGQPLMGRPRLILIVDDDQGGLRVDDEGFLVRDGAIDEHGHARARFEIPLYHYPVKEKSKAVGQRRPFKRDDDWIDDARYICRKWGPPSAELNLQERIEQNLPEKLRNANLPPLESAVTPQQQGERVELMQARERAIRKAERELKRGQARHWRDKPNRQPTKRRKR